MPNVQQHPYRVVRSVSLKRPDAPYSYHPDIHAARQAAVVGEAIEVYTPSGWRLVETRQDRRRNPDDTPRAQTVATRLCADDAALLHRLETATTKTRSTLLREGLHLRAAQQQHLNATTTDE